MPDGTEVFYTDDGAGPAVMLSHSCWTDHDAWDGQVAALSSRFRVVCVDSRGHGPTRETDAPYDYWRLARDHLAVADHLGLNRFVAGGVSSGAMTGMHMALLEPARIGGLVLIGTSATAYSDEEKSRWRDVLGVWLGDDDDLVKGFARALAAATIGGRRDVQMRWVTKWLAEDRQRMRNSFACLINRPSLLPELARITCGALLIRGAGDQAFSDENMITLRDNLGGPTSPLHTVEGANHLPNISHPEIVSDLIADFLERLDLGDSDHDIGVAVGRSRSQSDCAPQSNLAGAVTNS
ncbi:alpha/beta fold hydrolase [Nocardia stercoris]|uniref:alpha/beta fold hydrolase n=1 Tax=Nocardia stercoris TaxID=2483361 RepID=UPI00131A3F8C|nr:alpha/beta hydrolase [Nocardia stercoris]